MGFYLIMIPIAWICMYNFWDSPDSQLNAGDFAIYTFLACLWPIPLFYYLFARFTAFIDGERWSDD